MNMALLHTGVNSMEVVEIRSKSKPFNRPLDVFFDVSCRVDNTSGG
jgi:hypothetical protein